MADGVRWIEKALSSFFHLLNGSTLVLLGLPWRGERDQLAAAHAAFYVELGERAETGLRGSSQARWVRVVREEHPNLRAALAWLITQGEADPALRLAGSLGMYWHLGRHLEGRETLRARGGIRRTRADL